MKVRVTVDVTLTFTFTGSWQKDCSLEQIQSDAKRASGVVVSRLHSNMSSSDRAVLIATKRNVSEVTILSE